jgi:hypothetical protein
MKVLIVLTFFCGAAALALGCGGFPSPTQHMATAQASVRAAQEVGAQNDPQAALHLKLAQEELDRAKQLMNDGQNKRAEFVLSDAESDADLSVAEAKQASTRAQAQQVLDQLKSLKQQHPR